MSGPSAKDLARSQLALGERQAAAASARRAVEADPDDAQAWTLLGVCLEGIEPEAALSAWRKAITLAPHDAEPYFRLGDFERRRGRHDQAIAAYRAALATGFRHPALWNNLGLALQEQGQSDEAIRAFQAAIRLQPDMAPAHANLGDALRAQHRTAEAIAAYRRACELAPNVSRLWLNLGVCQHRVAALADARKSFERALALDPDAPDALVNLAASLNAESRYAESLPLLHKALARAPDHAQAQSTLLYVQQQTCAWDELDASIARQRALLGRPDAPAVAPHHLLALPFTPSEQLAAAQHWARQQLRPAAARPSPRAYRGEGKLRLGYASTDYRAHPLANLLTELIETHDRARVEVFAYSLGPDDGSAARARFERAFDHFADVRSEADEAIVQRIRDDRIAVLVDTNGYVLHARSDIFALRAAPIQINGIGFAGTLGADCYDFILTDSFVTPPEQQAFFTERFMLLPHCYMPGDTRRAIAAAPTRAQCNLPETGVVLCCFNASYKILPDVFAIWMRLLQRVAGSVLWLLATNREATANLREQARRHGVAGERLIFAPSLPLPAHLARHALADLFLDTFPYNAHTTANDALFAGLPLLTCAGETFASRVAGSQLRAIGLPELVADSLPAYEALALELAREPARLLHYRQRLAGNRGTQPLFDVAGYTRALEELLIKAWEEHRQGQHPDAVK
jgi:protein O-GlcNAc transferase